MLSRKCLVSDSMAQRDKLTPISDCPDLKYDCAKNVLTFYHDFPFKYTTSIVFSIDFVYVIFKFSFNLIQAEKIVNSCQALPSCDPLRMVVKP